MVDRLETDNRMEKGMIKRLEETQERERRKNEELQKEPLASHIKRGKWNNALYEACKIGNKEIVEMMIEKGANDWNRGLEFACKGGNKEIVEMVIEKGADDWNWGLCCACEVGNKEIVEIMIEKGADNLNEGLRSACEVGNKEIVELMIEKGANTWNNYTAVRFLTEPAKITGWKKKCFLEDGRHLNKQTSWRSDVHTK